MDHILEATSTFEPLEPSAEEKLKVPRCADQFIRLLEAKKERYCILAQPYHRLKFLDLQLELIDTSQQRVQELFERIDCDVNTVQVLNTLNQVIFVFSLSLSLSLSLAYICM